LHFAQLLISQRILQHGRPYVRDYAGDYVW